MQFKKRQLTRGSLLLTFLVASTPLGVGSQGTSAGGAARDASAGVAGRGTRTLLTPGPINSGSMRVSGFPTTPTPTPLGDHPFGAPGTILTQKNEVFYSVPGANWSSTGELTAESWINEDFNSGHGMIPGTHSNSRHVRDAASGNIDKDPEEELVTIDFRTSGSGKVLLERIDRRPDGVYESSMLLSVPHSGYLGDATIALGDFDGDFRDEVALVLSTKHFNQDGNRSWLRVFDDPIDGGGQMMSLVRNENHASMWAHPADLDGDGIDELVVGLEGDTTHADRFAVRVYEGGRDVTSLSLGMNWSYLSLETNRLAGRSLVGDFDKDGVDEIAYVGMRGLEFLDQTFVHGFELELFRYSSAGGLQSMDAESRDEPMYLLDSQDGQAPGWLWDVTAVDRFGGGHDEIAILAPSPVNYQARFVRFDAGSDSWTWDTKDTQRSSAGHHAATIRAADTRYADGAEEIYLGLISTSFAPPFAFQDHLNRGLMKSGGSSSISWETLATYQQSGLSFRPVIAPGDFDADGFTLRYTGNHGLEVSDPIPLVLLTAAPTKAGISQNQSNTSTSYYTGVSSEVEVGVSTGTAWSTSVGSSVEDPTGLFSASSKVTVEETLTKTQTVSSMTSFVQGFTGAYDSDTIVFQATLYQTFEYEILSTPDGSMVGDLLTLAIPSSANAYKWTVDYYNVHVPLDFQIDSTLLPHTIGDPASYRGLSELQPLLDSYVSWRAPGSTPVGQGNGTNYFQISLATESATQEQRDQTVGVEAEWTAGASVGASYSATNSDLYTISAGASTIYDALVGDISDLADYEDWSFEFGLAVYQPGRLANAANEPIGWDPGARPLTVVTFWTSLTGAEY